MDILRPRNLAIAASAYFAVVGYAAWQTARRTNAAWFTPEVSQVVYQTSLFGGILVLIGLLAIVSMVPRYLPARPRPTAIGKAREVLAGPGKSMSPDERDQLTSQEREWADIEGMIGSGAGTDGPARPSVQRASDAAAVSEALSRMSASSDSAAASLAERLSVIRARSSAILVSEGKDTAVILMRLAGELKPLLVAAKKAHLDMPEIRTLVAEVMSGQERDLAQRVRLVEEVKGSLEAALIERIAEELQGVLVDIERTKTAVKQTHDAELISAEAVALLDTGNYNAAMDRAASARRALERPEFAVTARTAAFAPSSFVALAGPSIAAVSYVAVSAMLLPGVFGFLERNFQLNTTAILALSYGWLGLLAYAIVSVYVVSRPSPTPRRKTNERSSRE